MPSASLDQWRTVRAATLDEIEAAHTSVGGLLRGRRYATQQINHAYVMLLSSQFQGFCRDLHSECAGIIVYSIGVSAPPLVAARFEAELRRDRSLDKGNPSPSNIGGDFGRLGIAFWSAVKAQDRRNGKRLQSLELLNVWRNAIAHQDFTSPKLEGKTLIQLSEVQRWRSSCDALTKSFDAVMAAFLQAELGSVPW